MSPSREGNSGTLIIYYWAGLPREGRPDASGGAGAPQHSRRFLLAGEDVDDAVELACLRLGLLDRRIGLLDQSRVVLGHLVHLADSGVDLFDRARLLAARGGDAVDEVGIL